MGRCFRTERRGLRSIIKAKHTAEVGESSDEDEEEDELVNVESDEDPVETD